MAVTGEEAEAAEAAAAALHERVEAAKKLAVGDMAAELSALKVVRGEWCLKESMNKQLKM